MSVRDQLFSGYIFYYSASQAWFFWSSQPNTHLLVTDHQSKVFRRVHLLFRVWNKFYRKKNFFASLLLSQTLVRQLSAEWEARWAGEFFGSQGGHFAGGVAEFLLHYPSSVSSRNDHIPAYLGGQMWGELGFTQGERISGSVGVLRTPWSKTSLCHLRINSYLQVFQLERKTSLVLTKQEHECLLFKGVETVESTAGASVSPRLFTLNRSQNIQQHH